MPEYHKSQDKMKARQETIIKPYKSIFKSTIPQDKQYWCLCATCAKDNGRILIGSELDCVIKERFCAIDNFHGVDTNKSIININKTITKAHWYNKSIVEALVEASKEPDFNPAVINFDSINGPKIAANTLADILYIISKADIRDVMIVCNIIKRTRGVDYPIEDFYDTLDNNKLYQKSIMLMPWKSLPQRYTYNGSNKRTIMTSFILYNKI